jgi:hypothetical protein
MPTAPRPGHHDRDAQSGRRRTGADPHHLSVGIDTIVVNGVIVRDEGAFTGGLPGRVLTPERRYAARITHNARTSNLDDLRAARAGSRGTTGRR